MSMIFSGINAVSAGEQMINSAFLGVIIAGLVWLLLKTFSPSDSKTRFAVWLMTLAAVVGLPFFGALVPSASNSGSLAPHFSLSASWAKYALVVWIGISLIGILHIAAGLLRLSALRRRCREVLIDVFPAEAQKVLRSFAPRRRIQVLISAEVKAPTAIGFLRPAVLLPVWALNDLSGAELRAVLLHELGHLSRWDDWTNLLQKLARAVFFFHPAVWWIDSKLCLEREVACDDLVLAHTGDSRSYAECLVSLAEKSLRHRGVSLAVAAVGHMRQMARRLSLILDPTRRANQRASKFAITAAATVAFAGFAASPHLPALVIFNDGTSIATANAAHNLDTDQRVNVRLRPSGADQPAVVPAIFRVSSTQQNRSSKVAGHGNDKAARKQISVSKRNAMRAAMEFPKQEFRGQAVLLVVETSVSVDPVQSFWNSGDPSTHEFDSLPAVSFTIYRFDVGKGNRIVHSEFVSRVI